MMRGEGTLTEMTSYSASPRPKQRGSFLTCMYPGPSDGLLNVILADGTRLSGWLGSQLEGGPPKTARFQPPIAPLSATRGFCESRFGSGVWLVLVVARVPRILVADRRANSSFGGCRSGNVTDLQVPQPADKLLSDPAQRQILVLIGGDHAWHFPALLVAL